MLMNWKWLILLYQAKSTILRDYLVLLETEVDWMLESNHQVKMFSYIPIRSENQELINMIDESEEDLMDDYSVYI